MTHLFSEEGIRATWSSTTAPTKALSHDRFSWGLVGLVPYLQQQQKRRNKDKFSRQFPGQLITGYIPILGY